MSTTSTPVTTPLGGQTNPYKRGANGQIYGLPNGGRPMSQAAPRAKSFFGQVPSITVQDYSDNLKPTPITKIKANPNYQPKTGSWKGTGSWSDPGPFPGGTPSWVPKPGSGYVRQANTKDYVKHNPNGSVTTINPFGKHTSFVNSGRQPVKPGSAADYPADKNPWYPNPMLGHQWVKAAGIDPRDYNYMMNSFNEKRSSKTKGPRGFTNEDIVQAAIRKSGGKNYGTGGATANQVAKAAIAKKKAFDTALPSTFSPPWSISRKYDTWNPFGIFGNAISGKQVDWANGVDGATPYVVTTKKKSK